MAFEDYTFAEAKVHTTEMLSIKSISSRIEIPVGVDLNTPPRIGTVYDKPVLSFIEHGIYDRDNIFALVATKDTDRKTRTGFAIAIGFETKGEFARYVQRRREDGGIDLWIKAVVASHEESGRRGGVVDEKGVARVDIE